MRWRNLGVLLTSILAVLLLAEAGLRVLGYRAGMFRKLPGFTIVDSLVVYENFTTDDSGIYKFSPYVTDSVPLYLNYTNGEITNERIKSRVTYVDGFDHIYRGFYFLRNGTKWQKLRWKIERWAGGDNAGAVSHFERFAAELQKDADTQFVTLVNTYIAHPFNSEGFRSIPFVPYTGKKKKVLLIGDSFVYGMSAKPFYNSFADILLTKSNVVYAAGIPGTDPAQYATIAAKYVPLLKPDVVVVCFYEGNDYMPYFRETVPGRYHEHMTNAGFFDSSPMGTFLPAAECYKFYRSLATIPENGGHLNQICRKTALGGILWGGCMALGLVQHPVLEQYNRQKSPDKETAIENTKYHIRKLAEGCEKYNAALKVVAIPFNRAAHNGNGVYAIIDTTSARKLFDNIPYYTCPNLKLSSDFVGESDEHFTNSGSAVFALYLDSLLSK